MKKIACWILCKGIAPLVKVGFSSSSWYGTYESGKDAIFINVNDRTPAFMEHLKNVHGFNNADNYSETLWTALHEMGHHFTYDFCEPTEELPGETEEYYNSEIEWEATEWAMRFIVKHEIICKFFNLFMK